MTWGPPCTRILGKATFFQLWGQFPAGMGLQRAAKFLLPRGTRKDQPNATYGHVQGTW